MPPKGLTIIEAMAPEHSRYACATKEDYFSNLEARQRLLAAIAQSVKLRSSKSFAAMDEMLKQLMGGKA